MWAFIKLVPSKIWGIVIAIVVAIWVFSKWMSGIKNNAVEIYKGKTNEKIITQMDKKQKVINSVDGEPIDELRVRAEKYRDK